jgi:hypothetical protein
MTAEQAKTIISYFNPEGNPVFFLTVSTPEVVALIQESLALHSQGKLKELFDS